MSERLFGFTRSELVEHHGWVSDVVFDNQQELVWVAGQKGYVTSYYSCGLQLYTKFFANDEVVQLMPVSAGILSLSSNRLNLHTRQGLSQHSFTSPNMTKMVCMCTDPNSNDVLIGGHTKTVTKYDLGKQKVVNEIVLGDAGCVIIRETPTLCCFGCPDGDIVLYDKNTYKKASTIPAHSGTISDFDICDNLLVSCGFASRGNDMSVKRSLLVYDLRMMRSLNAVHCSIDPVQLRFMPMYHSQVLIASQSGQFQQLEVTAALPQNKYLFEVDLAGSYCNAIDLSSTSKALAIGDSSGVVHLLASQEGTAFNSFSQPTYFPTENMINFPKVNVDDYSFPLSTVPMPHTTERLLSDWPPEFNRSGDRRTKPIDPEILRNMKMVGFVGGYSPNPHNMYKNTIPYELNLQRPEELKKREEVVTNIPRVYQRIDVDPTTLTESELHNYNRTKFSVFYNNKGNTYICTVLQMLYYLEPIALALKSHICRNTGCLACELGVLFYTLDVSDDKITDIDSFIQTFEQLPAAKYQDWQLYERHHKKTDYLQLPQSLLTFLLRHLHEEILRPPQPTSAIYLTFGSKVGHRTTCATCHQSWYNKSSINLTYTLDYPRETTAKITFVDLLKRTMQAENTSRHILCNRCGNYTPCQDKSVLESLPYILQLNCGMTASDSEFWTTQVNIHKEENHKSCPSGKNCNNPECKLSHGVGQSSWLPLNFHIKAPNEHGALQFARGLHDDKEDSNSHVFDYELCSVIAMIDAPTSQGLMLHSLVGRNYHQRQGVDDQAWYLFNGCSAISTHKKEATSFGQCWKTPCTIVYKQVKLPKELFHHSTPNPHELFIPFNIIPSPNLVPLSPSENLTKGELVGIGLSVEPAPNCLLRVVLVRGQGDHEGVPFSHDVCPTNYAPEGHQNVKLLYFKIKCLVDRGLILVGHSITKQLKYLNIHIPAQQYIDTAELYRPQHSEAIPPLQFLCPRILKVDNVPGAHNDAVFSLQLYEKFLDLKRAGQFEKTLKAIHSE
ncbi:hypothetical protein ACHWQZ_G016789 [Mnemiopsis leidyi]